MKPQIVWFKRDLRLEDHPALFEAAKHGSVIFLYILERDLWQQPDMSYRQYKFLYDCLIDLSLTLQKIGQNLTVKIGDACEILGELVRDYEVEAIWSHQETWNNWTYQRDIKVGKWAKENHLQWHEIRTNGVIRRLKTREGWAEKWDDFMSKPLLKIPIFKGKTEVISDELPSAEELGLEFDGVSKMLKGGRMMGQKLLKSFLYERGENYTKEMSSPVTAYRSCSLLSAYISFGALSLREVFQAARSRQILSKGEKNKWSFSMNSFIARLHWHCHFIQKLEDEPRIEFENFHSLYDNLREHDFNDDYFQAWKEGKTGFPMIDACMRALIATGWLNFRMRALLVSFASYHLWLDWRPTSLYLAKLFVDYEPGIHYSQFQMQSGTTGINSIRIYNPIKQSIDQDPEGKFIRKWITELENMPTEFIHTPWMKPEFMNGYPVKIVDEEEARKNAAYLIYSVRKASIHKEEADSIVSKHGSRKSGLPNTANKKKPINQKELPL